MSKTTTTVRMDRNGRLFRQTETGSEEIEVPPIDESKLPEEPAYDPDNPPLTPEQLARMKHPPPVKRLRRALMLSRTEFAERYLIPIATLRDWERGRAEPDAPAKAFLELIAADPEGAAEKLRRKRELNAVSP